MMERNTWILGAGMTGLGAGLSSGFRTFEANSTAGGICASYYVRPGGRERLSSRPGSDDAFRFEVGGGHWIWGGDPLVVRILKSFVDVRLYERRAGVFFPDHDLIVPYPLQYHLSHLPSRIAKEAISEIEDLAGRSHNCTTMAQWLLMNFGQTLYDLFFGPFHELYTAGLMHEIAPQDSSKNPVDLALVRSGALGNPVSAGYNASFLYPVDGLNKLAQGMASRCSISYDRRINGLDPAKRIIVLDDGTEMEYQALLSTLPLDRVLLLAGIESDEKSDPFTSVLVVNIGGRKGQKCPEEHWLYIPRSRSGFHRVGFYSNVDSSFLPSPAKAANELVSMYVEIAYVGGGKVGIDEINATCRNVVQELQQWGWLGDTEVVDPTWIDTAYTWCRPGSRWRNIGLCRLQSESIYQCGRYGKWVYDLREQGILHSIKDGVTMGALLKASS